MRFLLHNIQYGTGRLRRFAWMETLLRTTLHFPNITRFVRHMDPDIIGLVEVDAGSYRSARKNQAEELARELDYYHCHRIKYPDDSLGRRVPVLNKPAKVSRVPARFGDPAGRPTAFEIQVKQGDTYKTVHTADNNTNAQGVNITFAAVETDTVALRLQEKRQRHLPQRRPAQRARSVRELIRHRSAKTA